MYSLQGFPDEGSDNMKIEKVNENQIRCTLTREDLAERQIKLSELAYGTEKAKMLFRDMMQQAAYEFGFEADDIPLMIEAIPLSADTIILVITKVEYPEELDTRFSRFSDPDPEDLYEDAMSGSVQNAAAAGADDILGLFRKIQEEHKKAAKEPEGDTQTAESSEKTAKEETPAATSMLATVPSSGATTSFSIFIASRIRRTSPFLTACPTDAFTERIFPGIGAFTFTEPAPADLAAAGLAALGAAFGALAAAGAAEPVPSSTVTS